MHYNTMKMRNNSKSCREKKETNNEGTKKTVENSNDNNRNNNTREKNNENKRSSHKNDNDNSNNNDLIRTITFIIHNFYSGLY